MGQILRFVIILFLIGCSADKETYPIIELLKRCEPDFPVMLSALSNQENEIAGYVFTCVDEKMGKKIQEVIDNYDESSESYFNDTRICENENGDEVYCRSLNR